MKKVLLTAAIAFATLFATAQDFLVTTTIEKDANDEYSMESVTNNLAFGYMVNEKFMAGITMQDAIEDAALIDLTTGDIYIVEDGWVAAEMQLFARYYHSENLFAQVTTPWSTEEGSSDATDLMRLGAGYSVNVWNDLNVEASYSMLVKANYADERKGSFNIGVGYRF